MPELGFRDQSSSSSSATNSAGRRFRGGDASPDSVIFTLESNLSFFSSASASVDRCSFASDAHDHDSLASEISLHLAGHEYDREQQESPSGPDPDPNKPVIHLNRHRRGEKVKALKDESDVDVALDSARSSFSLALRECQEKRSRSDALSKKLERRRPASLDLNNVTTSSPRLGNIKKSSLATRKSGNFPSPGTPNYRLASAGMQKGWSSERVASHTGNARKQQSSALLLNGKTLPSKWEDAERWIFSPVSGDGALRSSHNQQPQRRPKSKSGPLGPPGVAYYSLYSPAMPMFEGGNVGNFLAASPFSAGVIDADGLAMHQSNGHNGGFSSRADPCMARSVSVHGCSEMMSLSSAPAHQDEDVSGMKDAATNVSRAVSRRDMATQMSPEGSPNSSPKHGPFSDAVPSITPTLEMESGPSCRLEVRDVQVDERVTMTRWSNKRRSRIPGKSSEIFDSWKKKDAAWDISDVPKSISKFKREEAKITAWENLQNAKAEAAIRKLEMKLEKERSSSMNKIMKKLKSAQNRAQDMRSSMLTNQAHPVPRSSTKALSFRRTTQKMSSLSGCFTCHAF